MDVQKMVKKAKKGNKEALLQLIMNKENDYYRLAHMYMGNKHDAMDALEDMVVRVYEKIYQLKKEESFYSWSKTILVNSCKTSLRKRNKSQLVDDLTTYTNTLSSTENPYHNIEQNIDLMQLLTNLNEKQAEAIKLKYFLDLDYETISEITNVSVGTVKSRVFEGLKKLRIYIHGGNVNE